MDEDYVSVFLIQAQTPVVELEIVHRTGGVFKAPVGMGLLGRVINAIGDPIDDLGPLQYSRTAAYRSNYSRVLLSEAQLMSLLKRARLAIDALVPIGRGQRELIIGNRGTGKTALQWIPFCIKKGKMYFCIYVSIGQRQANLATNSTSP